MKDVLILCVCVVCISTGEAAEGNIRVQRAEQRHQQPQAEAAEVGREAAEGRGGSSETTVRTLTVSALALTPPLMLSQERRREEALNQRLRRQVAEYEAPGVVEYMQAKEKHRRLQQSVHTWEKKVEVAQVSQGSYPPRTQFPHCHQYQLDVGNKTNSRRNSFGLEFLLTACETFSEPR